MGAELSTFYLLGNLAGIAGGALGAKSSGAEVWKGAAVALAFALGCIVAASPFIDAHLWAIALFGLVCAAIAGHALGMTAKQVANTIALTAGASFIFGFVIGPALA